MSEMSKEKGKYDFDKEYPINLAQNVTGILRGFKASAFVALLTSAVGRFVTRNKLKSEIGIPYMMSFNIENEPVDYPLVNLALEENKQQLPLDVTSLFKPSETSHMSYRTISDYHDLYLSKKTTPQKMMEQLIKDAKKFLVGQNDDKDVNYNAILEMKEDLILEQAKRSTERYEAGAPLSILDGVPFFAKEDVPVKGYPDICGSDSLSDMYDETSLSVKRLMDAGAIHCGATVMVMFGLSTIGCNPSKKHGSPKNPNNTKYYCGGSSSGCGCIVSAGLVPFTIATDSVGSVRIPAAVCGVVGLKATFARICHEFPLKEYYCFHLGTIACCARDAAIVYGIIAGPSPNYPLGLKQPDVVLPDFSQPLDISSYRFATIPFYNKLSKPEVFEVFQSVLETLQSKHQVKIQNLIYPELEESRSALIILALQGSKHVAKRLGGEDKFNKITESFSRLNITMGLDFNEKEILQSRKQVARAIEVMKLVFEKVDFILLPTCGVTAYESTENDKSNGVIDLEYIDGSACFTFLGNCTGAPCISINAGKVPGKNLPVGLQIIAPWWKEDLMLRCAHTIEEKLAVQTTPLPQFTLSKKE